MKNAMKRSLALVLALLMIVTSDSGVLTVWADEQNLDPAAISETGGEPGTPVLDEVQTPVIPEANEEPTEPPTELSTEPSTEQPAEELIQPPVQEEKKDPVQDKQGEEPQEPEKETTSPAPGQEADSKPEATVNSVNNGIALLNNEPTVINFDMGASVSPQEVSAGDQFTYEIGYNLTALPEGQSYQSMSMKIDLNAYKDFLYVGASKDITVIGADADSYELRNHQLIVRFPKSTATGVAKTMKIVFKTRNFVSPNGTVIKLDPRIQGQADSKDVEGSIEEGKRPTVTIKANDGWDVKKSSAGVTSDKDNYYATYNITLQNQRYNNGTWEDQDWARYGRLDFAKDSSGQELFSLTDILPANTPLGGGASAVSVTMRDNNPNSGETSLSENTDYTVQKNDKGEITSLELKRYEKATQADANANQFAVTDKAKTTVYTVKVTYPKAAYVIPSNEDFDSYTLENTAKLKYTLLGQQEDNREATAEIELGEKETDPVKADIKVKKVWSVDGEEHAYGDLTVDGSVTFGLYLDQECTKRASNWNKTNTFETLTPVDKNGEAVFRDVRYGTYYLKETSVPEGYRAAEVIPVTISSDGTLTLGEGLASAAISDGYVKVTNFAENVGVLRFRKQGLDSEGKTENLKGAEFTLAKQNETDPFATAVSDENGLVLFKTIPAGTYTLKETKVSDGDYEVSKTEYTVTVTGGKVTDLTKTEGFTAGTDGIAVFTNISPKGKFQIKKISTEKKDGQEVLLEGAKFVVYGSANGSSADNLKKEDLVKAADGSPYYLVTDENGVGLSMSLKEGQYFVKEAEAPEGYQLSEKVKEITVAKNEITEIQEAFENEPKIPVIFSKKGILNQAGGEDDYKENLAGAVFSVWTSSDTEDSRNLVGYVKTYLDQTGVSVSGIAEKSGNGYELVKGIGGNYQNMILSAGTYYYKEEAAPSGFDLDTQVYEFTLGQGDVSKTIEVLDTTAYGQIEIEKEDAGGNGLTGAEFTIYNDEKCRDQDKVQTLELAGGETSAVSRLLPAGTYYIKETKAPSGYVKSPEIRTVTVKDKTKVSVTFINKKIASLEIKKADSVNSDTVLPGASFGLYIKTGENSYLPAADVNGKIIAAKKTGDEGIVTFENLEPGKEYYYKETAAPAGYVPDPEYYSVTLPEDTGKAEPIKKTITVKNSRMAKLVINKIGTYDNEDVKLSGVTFKIYKAKTDSGEFDLTNCTWIADVTTEDGKAEIDKLVPGIYWLVEQSYAGYETLAPQKVTLTDGMNQAGYTSNPVDLKNEPNQGRIRIEKISAADSSVKMQAVFTIYGGKAEGEITVPDTGTTYGTLTTDKTSGTALSGLLDPGVYFLKETSAPGGYVLDDTYHEVIVAAGKTDTAYTGQGAIKNVPKRKVVIKKYAQFDVAGEQSTVEYELAGMKFSVYKASGSQDENQKADLIPENLIYADVNMETYQKELELAPGAYWFVEDKDVAEEEHYHQKIQYFEVKAADSGTEVETEIPVEVYNTSSRGLIRVYKVDADTSAKLQGAEFELYKVVGESGGSYEADKDRLELVRASGSFGTDADKMVTVGSEGTAYTTPLEPGVYYLKETKAPDNYNILTEWTGPVEVTAGKENQVTVENKKQVDADGTKMGQETDQKQTTLQGAAIAAFASEQDAQAVQSFLAGEQTVPPADDQVKTIAAFNQYLEDNGVAVSAAAVAVSGVNGIFTFRDLSANTNYWLLEVKVPDGYVWNTEIYPVTTNSDGGFASRPTILNNKKGWVEVTKTTKLGSNTVLVPNVHFHVYEAVKNPGGSGGIFDGEGNLYGKGSLVAAGYTDAQGKYTSILLTPEKYYIVEEVGPDKEDTCDASGSGAPAAPDYIDYNAPGQVIYVPIGAATADVYFDNTAKNGKLSFAKIDAQTKDKVKAVFRVQRLEDGEYVDYKKNGSVYKITTSTSGITVSDWLEPGTYQLVEESAGTGNNYTLITISGIIVEAGKTASVTSGGEQGTVANNQKGTFTLNKQGWWKNTTDKKEELITNQLQGVTFKIYKKTEGNTGDIRKDVTSDTKPEATAITGPKGKITVKLDAGDYWFVETSLGANAGRYESLGDFNKQLQAAQENKQYFTIQPGKTTAWKDSVDNEFLKNYATGGRIQIKKIDVNTKAVISGVSFGIFNLNGKQVASMTTGADGIAISALLAEGSYYVKELNTPAGYGENSKLYGTFVVKNNEVTSKTTENLSYTQTAAEGNPVTNQKIYKIQVTKVDEKDTPVTDTAAAFALYKTREAAEAAMAQKEFADAYKTAETNANGIAVFNDITIESGKTSQTYYLVETRAPKNYELNTEIKEITVNYEAQDQTAAVRFADKKYGKLKITKTADWNWGNPTEGTTDLSGAVFTLYKVKGDQEEPEKDAEAAATLSTDSAGAAVSNYLEPGWYKIVETQAPEGFMEKAEADWVEVTTNNDLTAPNEIVAEKEIHNDAVKGRFRVYKWDGAEASGIDPRDSAGGYTALTGARFVLYRESADGDPVELEHEGVKYHKVTGTGTENFVVNGTYVSGMLETGKYCIVETEAPSYTSNGVTTKFELDPAPHPFEIGKGATVNVDVYNGAKGSVSLTKTGDADNGSEAITTAKFALFATKEDAEKEENAIDLNAAGITYTAMGNVYKWMYMDPGTYWIKELASEALDAQGYGVNTEPVEVMIEAGRKISEAASAEKTMVDEANKGRILIVKKDADTKERLDGAEFKLYMESDGTKTEVPDCTFSYQGDGTYLSSLIPADKTGTAYILKETKAPGGYSLDPNNETTVNVYPLHKPTYVESSMDSKNVVVLENKAQNKIASFISKIDKEIKNAEEEIYNNGNLVRADESLQLSDYTVDFKLSGYADGTNEVGAEKFIVTDDASALIPYKAKNETTTEQGDPTAYEKQTWKDGDYRINSVTLLPTSHGDKDQAVTADIYVKTGVSQNEWTRVYQNVALNDNYPVEKSFAENQGVMGVQVSYNNVGAEFKSDGMVLNVTFLQRESNKEAYEIRKITNQAQLYWEDSLLNEQGEVESRRTSADLVSNEVTALIPAYSYKLPQVSIANTVTTSQSLYYSGQMISFETTVTNHKLDANDGSDFKNPLVTIQMPAHTGLDQSFGESGFSVRLAYEGEDGAPRFEKIDPGNYGLTPIYDTEAAVGLGGGAGDYTTQNGVLAASYVFDFKNFTLKPGQRILIDYQGFIGYESKEDINQLISPAYLSSTYTIPASVENPNGLSFTPYNQVLVTNPVTEEVDKTVDTSLEYLNAPTVSTVADLNQIAIEKVIGVEAKDGENFDEVYNGKNVKWLATGTTAHVNPTDKVFYKLIFRNYSDTAVTSARIIDVLPYEGDHEVLPVGGRNGGYYIGRGTTTPADARMEVVHVSGGDSGTAAFYSTQYNWSDGSVDRDCADSGILGGIYSADAGWDGWTSGTAKDATAIGAEVDFGENGLVTGGSYEITMEVKTPGFSPDKVKDFYNKMMVNSTAVSVRRTGTAAGDIPPSDFTSSNKVMCTMDLPTGQLGDYVWYDTNENGVQDEGEKAAGGIKVTLTKETRRSVGGSVLVRKETFTETTDAAGKYLFSGLYCNYLDNPDITDPEDPSRYIGGEYYKYTVTFHKPDDDYGFTKQEVTGDGITIENDSNADENGNTSPITLDVLEKDGKLYGESNLTIDAGLIQPYAIGDRVWLDKNNNGIQDDGETGVADVNVLLYQVINGKAESRPLKTTKTDKDGLYKFTNLQQGQYVVEFDIAALVKEDGTYRYDFTKALDSSAENNSDSDAEINADGEGQILNDDGRILRTQVITLDNATLVEQGIRNKYDDRWDAGLVYYSALGGVAFDDTDYDDTHSQMRPLAGTKVELFLVNQGVREDQPIASAMVADDGSYYFDHLVFDGDTQEYSVKFTYPEGYTGVLHHVGDDTKDSDVDLFTDDSKKAGYIKSIVLEKGDISLHNDGGARKYAAIGDYVWNDTNKNGLQDEEEEVIPDVRVVLQYRENSTSEWKFYAETVTDKNGKYLFTDLKSSPDIDTEYRVVFALPRDTVMTSLNTGTNSAVDSDANGTYQRNILDAIEGSATTGGFVTRDIKPGYGETDLTWDAGIVRLYSSVGDYVWYDDDNDGVQDPEEKPVPGIKVVLERSETGASSSEWTVVGETITDENGKYLFDHLLSGYYRVKFQLPEEYRATRYGQNANDTASAYDSDAARRVAEGNWYYTRSFYLADGVDDMTWDAGIYKPVTRTRTTRVNRPTNRTVTRRVARQNASRNRTRTRTRKVKTGDNSNAGGWALVCISAIGAAYVLKRKKKNGVQQ